MNNCAYLCAAVCSIDPIKTGANIRNIRRSLGISVSEVADFFLIARNSVYKWERGESIPAIDNLYSLAWFFGVTMDQLVIGNRSTLDAS